MNPVRRSVLRLVVLSIAVLSGCAGVSPPRDLAATQALAPTGKLRGGLYPGTPTSILGDPTSGNAKGVGFDLGRELAQRARVPFDPVVFKSSGAVARAVARAGLRGTVVPD